MQFSYLIFIYATLLIIDGITFQILALERDPSILTPVIFGGILLIMGVMTLKKDLQIFGKHGATALSLIAFISSLIHLCFITISINCYLIERNNLGNPAF